MTYIVDVASILAVLIALVIIVVSLVCFLLIGREMAWGIAVTIASTFQVLRFFAIETTSFDPSSRYSWQPAKSIWRHAWERKLLILNAVVTTVPAALGGFYTGCYLSAIITSNLFAQYKDASLVASFVIFKVVTSILVFGTPCEILLHTHEQLSECFFQIKGAFSLSTVIGIGFVYLSPLSTAALTGFVAGAVMYCHGLQTLILKPCNLLHRPLDVVDVPVTSGKRSLAYAEGLTESLLKQQEVDFTSQLSRACKGRRLKFEEVEDGLQTSDPLVFLAQDILAVLEQSLANVSDHEGLPQMLSFIVFLLESLHEQLKFEDGVQVYAVDSFTMLSEGFVACAVGNSSTTGGVMEEHIQDVSIFVSVERALLRSIWKCQNLERANRLRRSPTYRRTIACIAESVFHEFVENETGSHKLALIAELILRRRNSTEPSVYLPENIIRQLFELSQKPGSDFERVFADFASSVESSIIARVPPTWRFSQEDWKELCQFEHEYQAEICNFCETLAPARATQKVKWHVLNWARIYYIGLTGDLEVNKEIRSYVEHYNGKVNCDKFTFLLILHERVARPIFESCIWLFAWTCSPLYLRFKAKDRETSGVHKSVRDIAPKRFRWSLELRPVLFETLEAKDQGQTFIPGALCTVLDEIVLRRAKNLKEYWKERHQLTRGRIDRFSKSVNHSVRKVMSEQSGQMEKLRSCHNASDLLIMGKLQSVLSRQNM